jgi:hypothetical protein
VMALRLYRVLQNKMDVWWVRQIGAQVHLVNIDLSLLIPVMHG